MVKLRILLALFFRFGSVLSRYSSTSTFIDPDTGGYNDISIMISADLSSSDCPKILEDIEAAFILASESLYNQTEKKLFFASIDIYVPENWTTADCRRTLASQRASVRQEADFYVGMDDPVHKQAPWIQKTTGCGIQGDFIFLPASFLWSAANYKSKASGGLSNGTSTQPKSKVSDLKCAEIIRNHWLQYRFGLFSPDLERIPVTGSKQDAFCLGRSPREMLSQHPDWASAQRRVNLLPEDQTWTRPRFVVSRLEQPRYVIVLENSAAMNAGNSWDLLRTAIKKFVHDLPAAAHLGLVLFNQGAHIAHPVALLTQSKSRRDGFTVHIENKFSLNPRMDSCVRCGLIKAIEALQTTGSTVGASVILISQGRSVSLSTEHEADLKELARRHRLQIFSMAIAQAPYTDLSLSLERLAFNSGGLSFFVAQATFIEIYVALLDAFREIQARTQTNQPVMVYERHSPDNGPSEESDSFVLDRYLGSQTSFNCFALYPFGTDNIKSISLEDRNGNSFKSIMDNMAMFHTLSVFNVPFDVDRNEGMNWTYSLERLGLPLEDSDKSGHVIQVISHSRHPDQHIQINFYTNLNEHAVDVSPGDPIIFYVEVKLNGVPVLEARVHVRLQLISLGGFISDGVWLDLLDNGNGDPDIAGNDGIYSRYLTDFSMGEGRYEVTVIVDDNNGRAFTFKKERGYGGRSCCQSDLDSYESVINQKLGPFQRIVRGPSFRVNLLVQTDRFPPARILDMSITVHKDTHELELLWTAPGDDFDHGQVFSYRLYSAATGSLFYSDLSSANLLEEIASNRSAGQRQSHRIKVSEYNKNVFYALVSMDEDGNVARVSNIKGAFMPSPVRSESSTGLDESTALEIMKHADDVTVYSSKKPDKVFVFIAVGVLTFIALCVVSVFLIVIVFRRKKKKANSFVSDEVYDEEQAGGPEVKYSQVGSSGSVYEDGATFKQLESRQFLTSSNLTDSTSQPQTDYSSFVLPPATQGFANIYANMHPAAALYAVPVPRSQRSRLADLYTSSPKTPCSSANSAQSSQQEDNGDLQRLVDTFTQEFANENAKSYLDGATENYYANLNNLNAHLDEKLSQTSSLTSEGLQATGRETTIKSILKKRNELPCTLASPELFHSNSSSATEASLKSQAHHDPSMSMEADLGAARPTADQALADLSPSKVYLETSFDTRASRLMDEDDVPGDVDDAGLASSMIELCGSIPGSEKKRRNVTQV